MARDSSVAEFAFGMFVFVYYVLSLSLATASVIHLQASPPTITPLMTHNLTVTCMINDTASGGSNTLVGKRDLKGVTRTPDDVSFIISIIIQRSTGEQVASITEHTGPQVLSQDKDVVVAGSLVETGGAKGYLSVSWLQPEESLTGQYMCEVNAIRQSSHIAMFTDSVTVTANNPTIADIIQRIHDNKREADDNKAKLLQQVQTLKAENDALRKQQDSMKTQQDSMKTHQVQHDKEIQDLTSQLSTADTEIKQLTLNMSTQVAFSAVRDVSNNYETLSDGATIVFNKALTNVGGGYNTGNGIFTCPVTGIYYIRYDIQVWDDDAATQLVHNSNTLTWSYYYIKGASHYGHIGAGLVLQLTQGDTLKVISDHDSQLRWKAFDQYSSMFSGYLLK